MNQPGHSTPPAKRWMILGFLLLICFISHFNRASITNAGDERIMKQYNISPQLMGWVYSSFLIVYTIFMIPGGWLIDRRGPKFALVLMVGGSAIFCACTGAIGLGFISLSTGVWVAMLIVRAAMGLCSTPLHPGAARSIGQWFPARETALANGIITGASIMAYALVHAIFGRLIDWFDWPRAFLCTGAATLALAIAWWWFGEDGPFRHHALETKSPRENLIIPNAPASYDPPLAPIPVLPYAEPPTPARLPLGELTCLTASYAAVGYFQYLFYWLHYYFDEVLKMGKDNSRFYAGLPNLAMAISMPIGGLLIGQLEMKFGRPRRFLFPLIVMLGSAACLLAGIKAEKLHWVVIWFTAALGMLGLCESAFWITAIELGGKRGGTSAAIMNTGGNGIGLLAPVLTPFISRYFGWGGGLCVGAFVAVAGAVCWLGIRQSPTNGNRA